MLRRLHQLPEGRIGSSSLPFLGLGLYLVTSIWYILPSGMPQPGDFLLLLAIIATLLCAWSRIPNEPALYFAVCLFIAWITLVNTVWFVLLGDYLFLKKGSFYLYNAVVFLFVVVAGFHDFERLKRFIWWACVIVLLAQLVYLELLAGSGTGRDTGTFNNPNQLGYWALLVMACLALAKDRAPLGPADLLALGAGLYITLLSTSRAALISAMLLIGLIIATCRCRAPTWLALGAALAIGLSLQVVAGGVTERIQRIAARDSIASAVSVLEIRLTRAREQGPDVVLKRGYVRLIEHPEYLAFGAGEGAFERMNEMGKEFHSTLGTVLMSYGVVGLGLFGLLLLVVFVKAPWTSLLYMIPIMLYGVTHMGLRFSEFWIFLGLVYAQARYGRERTACAAPAAAARTGSTVQST